MGVSNTLISEGIYVILVYFDCYYLLASFLGFSLSIINAYYWNNKYVFREAEDKEKRVWYVTLGKTYISYLGGYLLTFLLLFIQVDLLNISRLFLQAGTFFAGHGLEKFDAVFLGNVVAELICLVITIPLNFLVNKMWAFRQKNKKN